MHLPPPAPAARPLVRTSHPPSLSPPPHPLTGAAGEPPPQARWSHAAGAVPQGERMGAWGGGGVGRAGERGRQGGEAASGTATCALLPLTCGAPPPHARLRRALACPWRRPSASGAWRWRRCAGRAGGGRAGGRARLHAWCGRGEGGERPARARAHAFLPHPPTHPSLLPFPHPVRWPPATI